MLFVIVAPLLTNVVVRSYGWMIVLGGSGLINNTLRQIGFEPLELMYSWTAVTIAMAHVLLPFMVLPILANLLAQDPSLRRVAELMGAGPFRIFFRITLPLSLPGVLAGVLMNLALAVGMYITPALLGGRRDMMMANLVDFYTRQTLDWNLASAIAIVLLAMSAVLAALLMRVRGAGQFA